MAEYEMHTPVLPPDQFCSRELKSSVFLTLEMAGEVRTGVRDDSLAAGFLDIQRPDVQLCDVADIDVVDPLRHALSGRGRCEEHGIHVRRGCWESIRGPNSVVENRLRKL